MRALLIDDNAVDLKLQAEVLQLGGFAVERAADAETALGMLGRQPPDIIVTDIGLPGMDGLTLTRLIKRDPRYTQIPVVALTAFAMKGDDRAATEAGCNGYITKPIDTRRFADQIRAALDAAALRVYVPRPPG